MSKTATMQRLRLSKRLGPTQAANLEYFCRGCKGHDSRTVSLDQFWQTACRCGSRDLLIYNVNGETTAPLRG